MTSSSSTPGSKPPRFHSGSAEPRGFSLPENGADLRHTSPTVTAILVDAAFYLKRARRIFGRLAPDGAAKRLHEMALAHLNDRHGRRIARLYRILVYDAPPALWKGHLPVSGTSLDLSRTPMACWRSAFHEALRGMRKVALRLGEVPAAQVHWQVKHAVIKDLLQGKRGWHDLGDDDFQLALRQKGVDMRLGLDVASLAYKRQVNQIVLIAGDADFVPAAKLARREGIDFVLDPMWNHIRPALFEHIDGLRSVCPRPGVSEHAPGA